MEGCVRARATDPNTFCNSHILLKGKDTQKIVTFCIKITQNLLPSKTAVLWNVTTRNLLSIRVFLIPSDRS
jgi:hypothetical protein